MFALHFDSSIKIPFVFTLTDWKCILKLNFENSFILLRFKLFMSAKKTYEKKKLNISTLNIWYMKFHELIYPLLNSMEIEKNCNISPLSTFWLTPFSIYIFLIYISRKLWHTAACLINGYERGKENERKGKKFVNVI